MGAVERKSPKRILHIYPFERSETDIVGDEFGYLEKVVEVFGTRKMYGTALGYRVGTKIYECEAWLRWFLNQLKPKMTVEIGTWRGVTTALLAHYSDKVVTLDIRDYEETAYLWTYFGVEEKIKYLLVPSERRKRMFLKELDFDFAFIDGLHTYEGVKSDFGCVKKCGKVLFHDYIYKEQPIDGNPDNPIKVGVKQFVDTLPKDEVQIAVPFAYWQRKNG